MPSLVLVLLIMTFKLKPKILGEAKCFRGFYSIFIYFPFFSSPLLSLIYMNFFNGLNNRKILSLKIFTINLMCTLLLKYYPPHIPNKRLILPNLGGRPLHLKHETNMINLNTSFDIYDILMAYYNFEERSTSILDSVRLFAILFLPIYLFINKFKIPHNSSPHSWSSIIGKVNSSLIFIYCKESWNILV